MQRAGDSGPGCRASAGPEGDIAAVIDTDFVSGSGMGACHHCGKHMIGNGAGYCGHWGHKPVAGDGAGIMHAARHSSGWWGCHVPWCAQPGKFSGKP